MSTINETMVCIAWTDLIVRYRAEKPTTGDSITPPTGLEIEIVQVLKNSEDITDIAMSYFENEIINQINTDYYEINN